jgi:hypothetical protein
LADDLLYLHKTSGLQRHDHHATAVTVCSSCYTPICRQTTEAAENCLAGLQPLYTSYHYAHNIPIPPPPQLKVKRNPVAAGSSLALLCIRLYCVLVHLGRNYIGMLLHSKLTHD